MLITGIHVVPASPGDMWVGKQSFLYRNDDYRVLTAIFVSVISFIHIVLFWLHPL